MKRICVSERHHVLYCCCNCPVDSVSRNKATYKYSLLGTRAASLEALFLVSSGTGDMNLGQKPLAKTVSFAALLLPTVEQSRPSLLSRHIWDLRRQTASCSLLSWRDQGSYQRKGPV